jgi:hypothetical protein
VEGNRRYWAKQLKDGRAILAGATGGDYWDNAALIIFEAATLEEDNGKKRSGDEGPRFSSASPAV